jgi:glycosyltransferase involved in cell wall biosynthesis
MNNEFNPFLSVLTITYKRKKFLEEAIFSFLSQDYSGPSEMVIINDCADIKYVYEHEKIKIINLDYRFASISEKLKYGFSQCGANNIYRLDDDDLLCPWALRFIGQQTKEKPGMDVYRSEHHYFFTNNIFTCKTGNINNGNVYSRKYIMETEFPKKSGNEDLDFTFNFSKKVDIKTDQATMIYRWGMQTYHISTMGFENESTLKQTDSRATDSETGIVQLNPQFYNDYYSQLPPEELEKYSFNNSN